MRPQERDGAAIPTNLLGAGSDMPEDERQTIDEEDVGEAPQLDEEPESRERTSASGPARDTSSTDAEKRDALAGGWVDRPDWKGPPEKWKPATEFLAFRDSVLPLVQRENRQLRQRLEAVERERAAEKAEREQYLRDAQRQSLRLELRTARENGDWDKVDAITEKMMDLRPEPKPAQTTQTVDAATKEAYEGFVRANTWLKDRQLSRVFHRQLKLIADTNTADDVNDALAQAYDETKRMYPESFGRSNTPRTAMAESGTSHDSGNGNGRGWGDLKSNVRKDYEMMIDNLRPTPEQRKKYMLQLLSDSTDEHFRR